MNDPALNSIHLEGLTRREEFRRARQALLNARGSQTMAAEDREKLDGSLGPRDTVLPNQDNLLPTGLKHMLVDKDYIYPLKVGFNTIGRLPDNDVVISDAFVSRRHCAILVHASNGCELHDIASKNGTFVNGRPLAGPTPLCSGDEIRMCERNFVFVTQDDRPPPVPTPAARSASEETQSA